MKNDKENRDTSDDITQLPKPESTHGDIYTLKENKDLLNGTGSQSRVWKELNWQVEV